MSRSTKGKVREQELTSAMVANQEHLLSIIKRRVSDQIEAEDVLQDTFAEFLAEYDLGRAIESLGGWLVRVAQNKIIDRFRKRKTQIENQGRLIEDAEIQPPADPEMELNRARLREEIAKAVALLPSEQRDVFIKHELEGKSFETMAAEMGVSVNTLLSRKRYAVMFLREYLKEVYDVLS